jgi:hypothetical protein
MGVSLAALVVAASGGAYAAVTASQATIVACVHNKGGGLYSAQKCARRDKRLTWNVIGPVGPAGGQGPAGAQGSAGAKGSAGAQGPAGTSGALAYAYMDRTATLKDTRNFSGFTHPSTGTYCLVPSGGVSATTSPVAVLTAEYERSATSTLAAYLADGAPACPAGDYTVLTTDFSGTSTNNVAFFIVVPS